MAGCACLSPPEPRMPNRTSRPRKPFGSADLLGTSHYERKRDLPTLIALWPWEIETHDAAAQRRLVTNIRRALRIERQRGVAGHWAYDLTRHARLITAYRCEAALLTEAVTRRPGACRDPFSWPVPSAPPRSSEPPSDSRAAGPTSRDILPETSCNGCEDGA